MNKQKVVLVGPTATYFKGGIVHYTQCLLTEFKCQKWPVKLIGFSRGYPKHFFPGASIVESHPGGDTELLDWLNPWSWYSTAKAIAKEKPQIVVWQWWTWFWTLPFLFTLWFLKRLTKAKIVIIAHNPFDHEQALYKQWGSHLVLSLADKILVPNKKMQKQLKLLLPTKSIETAFHPLYDFFLTGKYSQAEALSSLQLTSPLLLFFGHVRQYKGLAVLLSALDQLWQKGQKINLLIVGEFWEDKQKYLDLVDPKHQQYLTVIDSYVPDNQVEQYFAACDAVVIPYLSGSGSGPAKIALAFNKPLIATNVADNPDLFKMAKVGELIKPNSAEALSRAILKVVNNKEHYLASIEKVKPTLTWRSLVAKIVS